MKLDEVDIFNTDMDNAPFSFLNYLFWKKNIDIQSGAGHQILEHELTHIRQKHTWDKLFMHIVASVMWFNPFYWLVQRELSMIHEFLADEKAVGDQDVKSFASMLLEAHFGKHILEPTNSFAYRPIKRRLQMLTSSSKPKYSYMRRLFLLPLMVVVMGLFAFTIKKQDWKVANIDLNTWAHKVGIDLRPYDSIVPASLSRRLPDSLIIIRDNKKRDTVANINKSHLALIEKQIIVDNDSANKVIAQGSQPEKILVGVKERGLEPLYVIDGIPLAENAVSLKAINPNDIESINVLKDASAQSIYGAKAKNGLVFVTTKSGHKGTLRNDNIDTSRMSGRVLGLKLNKNPDADELNPVVVVGYGKPKKEIKPDVDKEPEFVGGNNAWKIFLLRNLRADVPTNNGAPSNRNYTVIASFLINKKGRLSQIKTENDPGYGTAKEVVRLFKKSPVWEPAMKNGKPVAYRQRQQITFQVTEE